jgi:hypothetical protein
VLGRARLDLLEKMTMLGRHVSRSGAACPPQPRTKLFAFGVERAEVVRSLAWLARECVNARPILDHEARGVDVCVALSFSPLEVSNPVR